MPARIPDHKRVAILADIRAGKKARNQIARDHGVSVGSITNIARENDVTDAFDRSATKEATAAAVADHRARLAALAGRYAFLAETVLTSFEAMEPKDWAKTSMHSRAILAGIAADKAKDLTPDDEGTEGVISLLGGLFGQLKAKHADSAPE